MSERSLLRGRRADRAVLLLLLLIGATYWLALLPAARNGYDQAYQIYLALGILDDGQLPLIGQASSVFLDNPALMAYLLTLPLLVWRSIWAPYLFVAMLNLSGAWLIYLTGRRLQNRLSGTLAMLLYAVNPWVIHYGRMTWTQGLMPFLLCLLAWAAFPLLVEGRAGRLRLAVLVLALIVLIQTYVLGVAVLAPLLLLLLLLRPHISRRAIALALLLLALSFVPYLIGLRQQPSVGGSKAATFLAELRPALDDAALEHALRFVTGQDYNGQDEFDPVTLTPAPLMRVARVLLTAAVFVGALRLRRRRRLLLVLLLWIGVPLLGFSLLPTLLHPHYMILTFPAVHLLAASGLQLLLNAGQLRSRPDARRAVQIAAVTLLLAIAVQFRLNLQRNLTTVRANPVAFGFNGWGLTAAAELGAQLRALGDASAQDRLYAADHPALLSSIGGRYVWTLRQLSYPNYVMLDGDQPLLYLLLNQPLDAALAPFLAQQPTAVRLDDGNELLIAVARPANELALATLPQETLNYASDAGLTLLGYSTAAADGQLTLTAYWQADDPAKLGEPALVGIYYKLFDDAGNLLAETNEHAQWNYNWRAGDLLIERVTLPLPAAATPLELEISLFDPINGRTFLFDAPAERLLALRRPLDLR